MHDRAYALLHVKAFDADAREFSGIATTPEVDRQGHEVDPLGVSFANPLPLLFHHDQKQPVGTVTLGAPTVDGVTFTASIPVVDEPGRLKERTDEAWQSVKAGLIRGVSIGFKILEGGARVVKAGRVLKLLKIEVVEMSLVTVPANVHASILTVKSLAETGQPNAPARGTRTTTGNAMTIREQITTWENTRAATVAAMDALIKKSADAGETLGDKDSTTYDELETKLGEVDIHLRRLGTREKAELDGATRVVATTTKAAADVRTSHVVSVRPTVPPGTAFVRAACAALVCKGNFHEAAEYAKRWDDTTPEVALYLKAAIAPGTVTDPAWAGALVNQNIANDFIALLRPATILGKIPGLRNVPFNTKVPAQTAGGTYGWVGEAKPKPVTKLAFSSESLGISKAAGIIVLTEELVRLSNPSAEALVRADMIAGIAQFLDQQFIDPAVAAVAGVNPASITNGAPTAAATANPLADIMGLINHFVTNNISVDGVTFIMSAANALALSFRTNLDGSPEFPGVSIGGGSYRGLNFVTSSVAGANVIALQPAMILYADEGGVTIDASREASLQMDSAPASPADATTVMVSLWQHNLVGLRAERFVNWKRANANAVKYLTAANYPAPAGGLTIQESPTRNAPRAS
jgi:HK97 family phage major capsid protein/HK97 family phage prohead protease